MRPSLSLCAVKKKQIDAIQIVANIAARKYHADLARPVLDEPKYTMIPDKIVKTDTVINSIVINCTCTSCCSIIPQVLQKANAIYRTSLNE